MWGLFYRVSAFVAFHSITNFHVITAELMHTWDCCWWRLLVTELPISKEQCHATHASFLTKRLFSIHLPISTKLIEFCVRSYLNLYFWSCQSTKEGVASSSLHLFSGLHRNTLIPCIHSHKGIVLIAWYIYVDIQVTWKRALYNSEIGYHYFSSWPQWVCKRTLNCLNAEKRIDTNMKTCQTFQSTSDVISPHIFFWLIGHLIYFSDSVCPEKRKKR